MDAADEGVTCQLEDQPFDVDFHPTRTLLACGLITGAVQVFSYTSEAATAVAAVVAHPESCRAVRFTGDGKLLMTASLDRSIAAVDAATGRVVARLNSAMPAGINRLCMAGDNLMASGDDDGGIRLWDLRARAAVATLDAHDDFVSDLAYVPDGGGGGAGGGPVLLSTSGDGTLGVWDLSARRLVARSENAEDELLSVVVLKHGRKVIAGTQGGPLLMYSWGSWNDCSDRVAGHPQSVDALLPWGPDALLSGSSDGLVRLVGVLPHSLRCVVGEHGDYPLERLALDGRRTTLASASHDSTVKLWDVSHLDDAVEEDDGDGIGRDALAVAGAGGADMDDDSDSEEQKPKKRKGKKKKRSIHGGRGDDPRGGGGTGGRPAAAFFAGLA